MALEPITRAEQIMSGERLEPITREEMFLAKAAGMDVNTPEPITRREMFLSKISGGSGGGSGDQNYEIELMTLVEELSISDIMTQIQYCCKYKNSVIQLRGYGDNPPSAGEYTVNCYELIHKGTNVVSSADLYTKSLVSPNYFINGTDARFDTEKRTATIDEATGAITIATTTSKIGGIGTKVMLYESPMRIIDERQTSNVWGE